MAAYSCLIAAHWESGPDVRICTGMSPSVVSAGKYSGANRFSPTALYQSTMNTACRIAAASPTRRTWVSRQEWKPLPPSRCSWPMFIPPVYPMTPSMTVILR